MKILIISNLKRKITKEITASRSQIIYRLSKGLAKKGHKIFILGTADTFIEGCQIIPVIEKGWVDLPPAENQFFLETSSIVRLIQKMVELHNNFDIIHNHLYPEFLPPLVENELKKPLVTTVHSQWTPFIDETFSLFKKTYLISISNPHKNLFKKTKFHKVIHNGIDTNLFAFNEKKEDYFLWIGRLSKAKNKDGTFQDPKGVRWAIRLAKETGIKLILTGNVEDYEFFEKDVKPYLYSNIQWYGPVAKEQIISQKEISQLMVKARGFLMTINWQEPFGLVMAEAMSCGTPVVGFDRGSVPEVVVNGKTGFVVPYEKGLEGLKEALAKINQIKPQDCRDHVIKNFSVEKMVNNYERFYQEITNKK